ncbi:EAL domain-containing protein [Halalkalibacter urbisdiaboli]|uniref:EAL domain-containing protein n=1 Tax=Halalkalibacter urbisdiaboli TaxID=1960589 RepID=UPI0013FD40D8|nr:EAL domain-containing protein [Halalkalibacter urbisdiaboli]
MKTHKTIGVLTPVLDGFYCGNLLTSISNKAKDNNFKVVIIGTSASNYSKTYASDYIDGWIVIMDAVDDKYIKKIRKNGTPIIGINTLLDCDYKISINNEEMIACAVNHLVKHGHDRIAYVGDSYFYDANQRFTSYVKALKNNQIKYQETLVYNTLQLSPYDIVKSMVENSLPCTAIVAVNDFIAVELIHHFEKYNIRVPDDVAIIGFDDSPAATSSNPSLSTIHLSIKDIGEQAVSVLIDYFSGEMNQDSTSTITAYPIFRESCGCSYTFNKPIDTPSETIDYLSNMVARNFNLGQLLQSSNYKDIIEMNWLIHTPFRKGLLGLWDSRNDNELKVHQFNLDLENNKKENIQVENCIPSQFPLKRVLYNEEFMQDDNEIMIIPIIQEGKELGVIAFVGLADITTQATPLNTTYQLANFFAAALHRASMHEEIKSYSQQLEIISSIMYDGIWTLDWKTKKVTSQGGINNILGYSINAYELHISEILKLIHPKEQAKVKISLKEHISHKSPFEVECRFLHAKGHYIWMYITGQAQYNSYGEMTKILGSIMDISTRKKAEERINELAYRDTLTGLSNRLYFEEQLIILLEEAKHNNNKVALLLFDLDRFKIVNDSYGHQAGDRLLQFVAARVRSIAKEDYLIARLGGDEFVVVMPVISSVKEAYEFGSEIVECLSKSFLDQGREYHISSSIGLSVYPDNSLDAETMMLQADMAMYSAKAQGRNRLQLYSEEMNEYNIERLNMETLLRKALDRDELILHYQPLYEMGNGKILGVEALLRWDSPELGMVKPMDFIPLAEETGLIIPIGEWVVKEACLLNKLWENRGLPSFKIFVNISSRQLNDTNFVECVKDILKETDCFPGVLCLEITETTMLEDITYSTKTLQQLVEMGVNICIDDFGTGYSSFSVLKNLPVQMIKIDKSFIDDIATDLKNSTIVQAIIHMSHIMSLKVVAEGVETAEQMEVLKKLEVDYVQGFIISKPVPYEEL